MFDNIVKNQNGTAKGDVLTNFSIVIATFVRIFISEDIINNDDSLGKLIHYKLQMFCSTHFELLLNTVINYQKNSENIYFVSDNFLNQIGFDNEDYIFFYQNYRKLFEGKIFDFKHLFPNLKKDVMDHYNTVDVLSTYYKYYPHDANIHDYCELPDLWKFNYRTYGFRIKKYSETDEFHISRRGIDNNSRKQNFHRRKFRMNSISNFMDIMYQFLRNKTSRETCQKRVYKDKLNDHMRHDTDLYLLVKRIIYISLCGDHEIANFRIGMANRLILYRYFGSFELDDWCDFIRDNEKLVIFIMREYMVWNNFMDIYYKRYYLSFEDNRQYVQYTIYTMDMFRHYFNFIAEEEKYSFDNDVVKKFLLQKQIDTYDVFLKMSTPSNKIQNEVLIYKKMEELLRDHNNITQGIVPKKRKKKDEEVEELEEEENKNKGKKIKKRRRKENRKNWKNNSMFES